MDPEEIKKMKRLVVENKKLREALEAVYEEAGSHTIIAGQTGGFAKIFDIAKSVLDENKEK